MIKIMISVERSGRNSAEILELDELSPGALAQFDDLALEARSTLERAIRQATARAKENDT